MEYATKAILGLLLSFSLSTYADVTVIHKGEVAPISGFLFDPASEAQAEQARTDAAYYKTLSDKLTDKSNLEDNQNQILEKRLQLYISESNTLAKDNANKDTNEKIFLLGSFALGVLATVLVVRNVKP